MIWTAPSKPPRTSPATGAGNGTPGADRVEQRSRRATPGRRGGARRGAGAQAGTDTHALAPGTAQAGDPAAGARAGRLERAGADDTTLRPARQGSSRERGAAG